jgi:hypothetical protein
MSSDAATLDRKRPEVGDDDRRLSELCQGVIQILGILGECPAAIAGPTTAGYSAGHRQHAANIAPSRSRGRQRRLDEKQVWSAGRVGEARFDEFENRRARPREKKPRPPRTHKSSRIHS